MGLFDEHKNGCKILIVFASLFFRVFSYERRKCTMRTWRAAHDSPFLESTNTGIDAQNSAMEESLAAIIHTCDCSSEMLPRQPLYASDSFCLYVLSGAGDAFEDGSGLDANRCDSVSL